MSQLGPAWVTVTLGCDCRLTSKIQFLWSRYSVSGTFDPVAKTLRFGGKTWKFEEESGRLVIDEGGERHEYTRGRRYTCR